VMRNGVIEQTGAPREIYDRPRTEFVAGFLGASNFLAGAVVAREGSAAIVETLGGRAAVLADSPVGQRVRIAIRPERLRIESVHGPGLPARIREIVYRGPVTHFYMESAGGPLLSYQQNAGAQDWSVGDEVRCSWDAESAVVLDGKQA